MAFLASISATFRFPKRFSIGFFVLLEFFRKSHFGLLQGLNLLFSGVFEHGPVDNSYRIVNIEPVQDLLGLITRQSKVGGFKRPKETL